MFFQDAMIRTLLLELSVALGVVADPEEVTACKQKLCAEADNIRGGLAPLSDPELEALAAEEVICEKLFDHYIQQTERCLLLTLLVEGHFGPLKEKLLGLAEVHGHLFDGFQIPEENDARSSIEKHLKSVGVSDAKDYFERYVAWLPAHRLRLVAAIVRISAGLHRGR